MDGAFPSTTRRRVILSSALVFVVGCGVGWGLVWLSEERRHLEVRNAVTTMGGTLAHSIERQLDRSLSATFALGALIREYKTIENFDAVAADMLESYGGIDSLQLAPGGVVSRIYPLAGNEKAIGHDLLKDPRRRVEALAAIKSRKLTLAGPFTLIQGGVAVIGRLPVFIRDRSDQDQFWGFTIVLIRLGTLLKAVRVSQILKQRYDYELARTHPDTGERHVFASSGKPKLQNTVSLDIGVPNGRWTLSIVPREGWVSPWWRLRQVALVLLVSALSSLLFYTVRVRRAERERGMVVLQEREQRFRNLVEGSIQGVIIHRDFKPLFVNQAFADIFGYATPDEILGLGTIVELFAPHERSRIAGYKNARLRGEPAPVQYEFQGVRKDGTSMWVETVARIVSWEGDAAILNSVFDVTERKQSEEELYRQREAHAQSEKLAAMGSMLAGVAHELNNPLAVVLGHTALFRRTVRHGPLAERVDKIARAAQRCARIVKNFLALARQYPAEQQQVQLNQVVREAVELLAYQLRVDDVEVTLELAGDLPVLWADPHQLQQVVVNLISNAHQAMRQNPSRRLTLTTRFDPGRGRVSLEVADTGPGIPPEIRSRIFEPFFTTKPPGQGPGLGLSLCQRLVESHGGSMRVESRPGRGAVFLIELPVVAPPVALAGVGPAEAWPAPRGTTILVVDDEQEVAGLLAEMLGADGHEVETAADGAMALDRLRERTYEVIVTDIRMPGLDGPGLYRELERSHPELWQRVIFITGDQLSPETREFLETTAAPRLAKPFDEEEVRRAIERVVRPAGQA